MLEKTEGAIKNICLKNKNTHVTLKNSKYRIPDTVDDIFSGRFLNIFSIYSYNLVARQQFFNTWSTYYIKKDIAINFQYAIHFNNRRYLCVIIVLYLCSLCFNDFLRRFWNFHGVNLSSVSLSNVIIGKVLVAAKIYLSFITHKYIFLTLTLLKNMCLFLLHG